MIRRLLGVVLIALAAAGCAGGAPDSPLPAGSLQSYRLDSGDKLRITVFGQMDLSGEFGVDGSGMVGLPLIPPVMARGATTTEFEHRLEAALGAKLLRNPSVNVEVTQYRPFFILGEVNHPGQYAYVNGMTVQTAAAIAGGFTYRAATGDIVITRHVGDMTFEGAAPLDAPVLPGDTLMVNERFF
jgi:polysaccharide export outer membrane protein